VIQIRPSVFRELTSAQLDRFHASYDISDGCWEWRGPLQRGYGMFYFGYQRRPAHRLSWEIANNREIPVDRVTDHLCRNTRCVNPSHLEPVPQKTNVIRGKAPIAATIRRVEEDGVCVRGHDLTAPDAWYIAPSGERKCKACLPIVRKERYRRDRQKRGLPDFVRGRLCNVEGCDRPHNARGWCRKHYNDWWFSQRSSDH